MTSLSKLENAIITLLQSDERLSDLTDSRIKLFIKERATQYAELQDGGILVQYYDSIVASRSVNGAALIRSPRFLVAVGGRRLENPEAVFDLLSNVIDVIDGAVIDDDITLSYDGDRFRTEYNGIMWYDIVVKTNAVFQRSN